MVLYTDLAAVLDAIGNPGPDFTWLLSDVEINPVGPMVHEPLPFGGDGPHVVSDVSLRRIVEARKLQFVWAVLSGFPQGRMPAEPPSADGPPYADGNPELWRNPPRIQHPDAVIEIVCWDSGSTLILAEDPAVVRRFADAFPEAVDLAEFNRRHHD